MSELRQRPHSKPEPVIASSVSFPRTMPTDVCKPKLSWLVKNWLCQSKPVKSGRGDCLLKGTDINVGNQGFEIRLSVTYNGVCMSAQLCLTLCYPMDCSPPGSSVQGDYPSKHWNELLFPPSGDLPDSGIKPISCSSWFGRQVLYHRVTLPEKLIYSGVKLEFNNRKKIKRFINPWKLDSTLLKNQRIKKKKLKVDRKRYLETREIWKQDLPKIMKCRESYSKREF